MKIFISHSFDDEELALRLKKALESSDQIKTAYMAQRSPNYELEISHKIINEILDSDYLVAIITKANCSRSVHQELGFAQGKVHKIPLIEKAAKKGVLLEGKESIDFVRENFNNACIDVLKYILEHGPTKKPYSQEEEIFVQKSAHFRFNVEQDALHFVSSLLHLLDLEAKNGFIFLDEVGREKANLLLQSFIKDKDLMINKLFKFELRSLISINDEFRLFQSRLKDEERFPHSELFAAEQDALVKLNERIGESHSLDIADHLRINLQDTAWSYDSMYQELVDQHKELPSLPLQLGSFGLDLRNIVKALIVLDQEYLKLRKKFGNLAFINTWDDETA